MTRASWRYWASQILVIFVLLWFALGGLAGQIRAPLKFTGDSLITLGNVKIAEDMGRVWTMPDLNAPDPAVDPYLLSGYAHVEHMLVKIARQLTRMIPFVVTLAWMFMRSEERRVGKECRSRWSP